MTSYYVSYRSAVPGRMLLGGVFASQSSRFSHRDDAEARAESVVSIHAGLDKPLSVETEICESQRPAEIVRHCETAQVVGCPCPECREIVV